MEIPWTEITAGATTLATVLGTVFGVKKYRGKGEKEETPDSPSESPKVGTHTLRLQTNRERIERVQTWLQAVSERQDEQDKSIATLEAEVEHLRDEQKKLDTVRGDVRVLMDRTRGTR